MLLAGAVPLRVIGLAVVVAGGVVMTGAASVVFVTMLRVLAPETVAGRETATGRSRIRGMSCRTRNAAERAG